MKIKKMNTKKNQAKSVGKTLGSLRQKPFGSPKSVVEYLGRYTHKIAISNGRIRGIDDKTVTFDYKDYRQKGIKKQMVLSHEEFIRSFAMHILPKRFVKIRHYGFEQHLETKNLKTATKIRHPYPKKNLCQKPFQLKCSCCKTGNLVTIAMFDLRGPPQWFWR